MKLVWFFTILLAISNLSTFKNPTFGLLWLGLTGLSNSGTAALGRYIFISKSSDGSILPASSHEHISTFSH
jgi:hypothetical protein